MSPMTRRSFAGSALAWAASSPLRLTRLHADDGRNDGIERLRRKFQGVLLTPGAPSYEDARFTWNHRYDRHPYLIARCTSASDVLRVLEYAHHGKYPIAVRSGGHSLAGLSTCDRGVVIDLSAMDQISFDEKQSVVVAQPGARIAEVQSLAASHGKVAVLPGTPSISTTGAVLAAAIGDLTSRYGTAAAYLTAADGILADGREVIADQNNLPDLLWALRGAGADFLIATRISLSLVEAPLVFRFNIICPPAAATDFTHRFVATASKYRERLCPTVSAFGSPGTPGILAASGLFFGSEHDGKELVGELTRGIEKAQIEAGMDKYAAAVSGSKLPPQPHFATTRWATSLDNITDQQITDLFRCDEALPFMRFVTLNPAFGVQTTYAPESGAYCGRKPGIDVGIWADAINPQDGEAADRWTLELWSRIPGEHCGGYPSLLEPGNAVRIAATYGVNYNNLRKLKTKFDPGNLLNSNVNIPPL